MAQPTPLPNPTVPIHKPRWRYPPSMEPDGLVAAWAAGFFDGEGTIAIIRDQRQSHRNSQQAIRLSAPQVVREPLDVLRDCYGGSVLVRRPTGLFVWSLTASHLVYRFLSDVLPHLRVKGAKAREALEVLGPPADSTRCSNGHLWTDDNTMINWRGHRSCRYCKRMARRTRNPDGAPEISRVRPSLLPRVLQVLADGPIDSLVMAGALGLSRSQTNALLAETRRKGQTQIISFAGRGGLGANKPALHMLIGPGAVADSPPLML